MATAAAFAPPSRRGVALHRACAQRLVPQLHITRCAPRAAPHRRRAATAHFISLPDAAAELEATFFEVAVQPRRRPAAEALSAFVAAASAAYAAGHAPSALALYGAEFGSASARGRDGPRLTAAEASFRPLWLATVYETLRQRGAPTRAPPGEPASAELSHRVAAVLAGGARTPLDPALRAGLASLARSRRANPEGAPSPQRRGDDEDGRGGALRGGVGSCLPPQAVPVSQLVLMTCQLASQACAAADGGE